MATRRSPRVGGQGAGRIGLGKLLHRGVPRHSGFARPNVAFDRLERPQPEDGFGVDRVRVAAQSLDLRDAQRFWPKFEGRARRRPCLSQDGARPVESARELEITLSALFRLHHRLGPGGGRHALQKTGRDGRLAAAFPSPAQDRLARSQSDDEIMRRLADAPLRRGKAEGCAHRPVEKGVSLDRGRPNRFVEARQEDAIEAQETRFEQAEDHEARVAAAPRRRAYRGESIVEQGGVFLERRPEVVDCSLAPFIHELGQLLEPVRILGRALGSCNGGGKREPMLSEAIAQGGARPKGAQRRERGCEVSRERFRRLPVALADAADRRMRVTVKGGFTRRREGAIEIVEGRERDGAKDGELKRARRRLDLFQRATEADRGMREERKARARRELDRGFEEEPGQGAGRALA